MILAKSCWKRRRVFEEQGIGGASIETIAAAAGFTRGAFYSNFKSKDELIIAMLEDHPEQTIRRNLDLLARHKSLADFIDALKTMDRSHQDPVGRSPLLLMEMILFVARAEKRRGDESPPLPPQRVQSNLLKLVVARFSLISRCTHRAHAP